MQLVGSEHGGESVSGSVCMCGGGGGDGGGMCGGSGNAAETMGHDERSLSVRTSQPPPEAGSADQTHVIGWPRPVNEKGPTGSTAQYV